MKRSMNDINVIITPMIITSRDNFDYICFKTVLTNFDASSCPETGKFPLQRPGFGTFRSAKRAPSMSDTMTQKLAQLTEATPPSLTFRLLTAV
jgi:hypothetical protein